jgi:hypothetical protein
MGKKPQGRTITPVLVVNDSTDPVIISGSISVTVTPTPNPTSFTTQQLDVAAAGTAQQLASSPVPDGFEIAVKAKDGNTGKIYLGFSQADAEDHTTAFILSPGQGLNFSLHDPAEIWVDSDNNGDGVTVATIATYAGGGSSGGSGGATPNRPAFTTGQVNVAAPGTAQQLPAQAIPNGFTIYIRAKPTNSGNIYIGNSQANAQNHAVAEILEPGAFLTYGITNADLIWVDADDATDGILWTSEV